ncbi:hypothetical protein LXL04_030716 [Taraxacum kok-saghyz]
MLSDLYSDSDEYGSKSEEVSDEYYEEDDDVDVENRSERSCSYEDSESVSYSESGDDDHNKGSVSSNSVCIEASDDGEDEEFITRKHTRTTVSTLGYQKCSNLVLPFPFTFLFNYFVPLTH